MEIDEAETEAETETKTGNQTGEKLITSQIFGVPCLCFQLWEFLWNLTADVPGDRKSVV